MSEMSPDPAQQAAYVKAIGDRMGDLSKFTGEALTNSEVNVYRIIPTMSAVPDEWNQGANRAFWSTPLPEPPPSTTAAAGARAANNKRRPRQSPRPGRSSTATGETYEAVESPEGARCDSPGHPGQVSVNYEPQGAG